MIKPASGLLLWYLRKTKFIGITLPPFGIYLLPEKMTDERLIKHENKHWEQYQNMGFFKFYVMYLYYSAKFGYFNNPMEVEARNAEV